MGRYRAVVLENLMKSEKQSKIIGRPMFDTRHCCCNCKAQQEQDGSSWLYCSIFNNQMLESKSNEGREFDETGEKDGCNLHSFYRKKPPLGLKPKFIHDEQRVAEIKGAIRRFLKAEKAIPEEWVKEFNSYCL